MGRIMDVFTTRFGTLSVRPQDELMFDKGLVGLEDCHRWVLLSDSQNAALGWLQSIENPHVGLGIVSPRRFVPNYQLRIDRDDLRSLELDTYRDAEVVVVASRHDSGLTLNLRAPLVINVEKRLGCQVVSKDALPIQFPLSRSDLQIKRIA